jgi:hypothetical protein
MPKHLEELQLSKEAQDLIIKLQSWLAKTGQYTPTPSRKFFDQCIGEGLKEEIVPLGDEVVKSITKVIILPKSLYSVLTVE